MSAVSGGERRDVTERQAKWSYLCCGSLKACGLIASPYTFLFCQWVCVSTQPLPCLLCVAVEPPWIRLDAQSQTGRKNPTVYGTGTTLCSSLAWQQFWHFWVQSEKEMTERRCHITCLSSTDQPLFYKAHLSALTKHIIFFSPQDVSLHVGVHVDVQSALRHRTHVWDHCCHAWHPHSHRHRHCRHLNLCRRNDCSSNLWLNVVPVSLSSL